MGTSNSTEQKIKVDYYIHEIQKASIGVMSCVLMGTR